MWRHWVLLRAGLRSRSYAFVLLDPRCGIDRPLALVGADGRAVVDARCARAGVRGVRPRRRRAREIGAARQQQDEPRKHAEFAPAWLRDRRAAGGTERPNVRGHGILDCRLMSGARGRSATHAGSAVDSQAMGGRLMRSGPRPLRASPAGGKTTEARL